jgi:hypothetical protein
VTRDGELAENRGRVHALRVCSIRRMSTTDPAAPRVVPASPPDVHYELSLALHEVVAMKLDEDVVARARHRTTVWLAEGGSAKALLERWREILDLPLDEIRRFLTDPSEDAAWLRKASPFAGEIPPREREQIIRQVRQRLGKLQ